ncbi:MAG: 2-C-methyl-D-erythritol 4-phosphate cytidylyltransferase [Spirochaetia bacterium]|nr:2-C-methyl-D-erythritol 4-phosphate cytidylyltransferase [Spirochaetia bacterium]
MLLLAGSGSRFGNRIPKQFLKLSGNPEPLFIQSLKRIASIVKADQCILVVHPDFINQPDFLEPLADYTISQPDISVEVISGGKTRHESFRKGTALINCAQEGALLVHDANRPFISQPFADSIQKNAASLSNHKPCLVPVIHLVDSVCRAKEDSVLEYPPREQLFRIQTPQMIFLPALGEALNKSWQNNQNTYPDEGSFMLAMGFPVFTYPGDIQNIKITYEADT